MALKPGSELWLHFTNIPEDGMAECNLCKQRLKNNRSYNLKLHLNKVHKNRSEIDKYFEIFVLEKLAVCRICNQRLQNRLCNLRLHMRRFHNFELKLPDDIQQNYGPSPQPYNEDKIKAVLKAAKRKMTEQIENGGKRSVNRLYIRIDKKTIMRSMVGLIVEDGVSPHLLRSKHIQSILRPMCEAISDKQGKEFKMDDSEIEEIISLVANYIRKDFSNDLNCRLLSIKIHTDVNAPANTFGIIAKFIKEGEAQERFLGIINLKDECVLNEDHIKQILYKYNIDSNQIINAFWDNTKHKYKKQIKNSEYMKQIKDFMSYPDIYLSDVQLEPYLGTSAQLCLLDVLQSSYIFQLFMECRNLVKFIADESNGYHEIFISNNLSIPQLDSPWRFGSTCKMMNDLFVAQSFLQTVKIEQFDNIEDHFNSNDELWSFIEAFCKSTIYLQKSILKFNNEEMHIGDFYTQWLKCKLLTEKLLSGNTTSNKCLSLMLKDVLKHIEKRIKELLSQDRLAACLYLDPRFQRTLDPNQRSSAIKYLKSLWTRAKLYAVEDTENNELEPAQLLDDEDAYLNEFLSHNINTNDKTTTDVFQKIEGLKLAFQVVHTNILSFWKTRQKSDPEIEALSSICFAVPAAEVYDKRCYSHVYQLDESLEFSAFTKENLLTVRVNAHLLDDALATLDPANEERSNASSAVSNSETELSDDEDNNSCTPTATNSVVPPNSSTSKVTPSSTIVSSTELPSEEFI